MHKSAPLPARLLMIPVRDPCGTLNRCCALLLCQQACIHELHVPDYRDEQGGCISAAELKDVLLVSPLSARVSDLSAAVVGCNPSDQIACAT